MKRIIVLLTFGIMVFTTQNSAEAILIDYHFSGHFTQVFDPGESGGPNAGQPFYEPFGFREGNRINGWLTVDTERVGTFLPSVTFDISFEQGLWADGTLAAQSGQVWVQDDGPLGDRVSFGFWNGLLGLAFGMNFSDDTGALLQDAAFPVPFPDQELWDAISFNFSADPGQPSLEARGIIDSFTPVPEPATIILVSAGLIGMAGASRRRAARRGHQDRS